MQAYFESVPYDGSCAYCTGDRPVTPLPKPLAAVYCISLQEQPHRTRQATAEFHRIGLCRHVIFYRAVRGGAGERPVWESHRALARHALAHGHRHALMLEDDVLFRQPWESLAPRIGRALVKLPPDWWSFYLGHVPMQAYFVHRDVLRVRSACAHAYVASPRLLQWLAETEPMSAEAASWRRIGVSVDGAMANLPGMYALFPMVARQRFLGDYRVDTRVDHIGRPREWRDGNRWRYYVIFRGAFIAEAVAVILSPLHRLTLERNRRPSETWAHTARFIRASGLFDDRYYLQRRPDVAASDIDPLSHYMHYGAGEGAWPCPLFDPQHYAAQSPELGAENPLAHYIKVGTMLGRTPHPLFDPAFYVSRYGTNIPPGMHPLAHFLATGGRSGLDPHPLFDSGWYLSRHAHVRASGSNPLEHYLSEGWRNGALPHPDFDGELYLRQNPDVKAAGLNPLDHFVRHGQGEGRPQPVSRPL